VAKLTESSPTSATSRTISHGGEKWAVTHGSAVEAKDGDLVIEFSYQDRPNWVSRVSQSNWMVPK
jgi:hypothetical protein